MRQRQLQARERCRFAVPFRSFHPALSMSASNKCLFCSKTVYFNERVVYSGRDCHEDCFRYDCFPPFSSVFPFIGLPNRVFSFFSTRCGTCKKKLTLGSHVDHENAPHCQSCYNKQFRPKGFGFGITTVDSFQEDPKKAASASSAPAPAASSSASSSSATTASGKAKFCKHCGTARSSDAQAYCGQCGEPL